MKDYPTIKLPPRYGEYVYVCDKADGSSIRAEWSRKKGFWKFGRRKALLDDSNPFLPKATPLFLDIYGDDLSRIFRDQRWQKAIAFFEFWGPQSFAGNHIEGDDFRVTLFDVAGDKKGILEPKVFYKVFGGQVPVAPMLCHVPFTRDLEEEIRRGELEGMSFEGVVCKGPHISPGLPLMFKVKTRAWLDRLKNHCEGDEALFEKLR